MSKCPHCKQDINLNNLNKETSGAGFFMQEIMYSCPLCDIILSISRGKFR